MAAIIEKIVPEVKVFGSVCLDYEIGGLNYQALEPLAKFGTKVVWMPTHSSTNSRANMRRLPGAALEGEGFSLLNYSNKLVPEVGRILSIVKKHNMVLANGHISPQETFALVKAAQAIEITKLVITHGLWVNGKVRFTLGKLKQWGKWAVTSSTASSVQTWDNTIIPLRPRA